MSTKVLLPEDEFYFHLFLKRLRNSDFRLALSYFFPVSFPGKLSFTRNFMDALDILYGNWIFSEAIESGGWQKQRWDVADGVYTGRLWEIESFAPKFSSSILLFWKDILEIYYLDDGKELLLQDRSYTEGDRIIIFLFTRSLVRRNQIRLLSNFSELLDSQVLNSFGLTGRFLPMTPKFEELLPAEWIFLQACPKYLAEEYSRFLDLLRFFNNQDLAQSHQYLHRKLRHYLNQVDGGNYTILPWLLEIPILVVESQVLRARRYQRENLDYQNPVVLLEWRNLCLEIGMVYEVFLRRLEKIRNRLKGISFVDEEYEVAQYYLKSFQTKLDPVFKQYGEQLARLYKEIDREQLQEEPEDSKGQPENHEEAPSADNSEGESTT